jgi:hypothetical protein
MSTCMEASQLIARPEGPRLITLAVRMAIESARSCVECECTSIVDGDATWWDTEAGLFTGSCDNDLEFRQIREQSVQFLADMDQIARHPDHPAWVRFIHAPV